jgi:hypothetical protein
MLAIWEKIVDARRKLEAINEHAPKWGVNRGWIRRDGFGDSHAEIAKTANVAPKTITNALSMRSRQLRDIFADALPALFGVGSLSALAESMLGRSGSVAAPPDALPDIYAHSVLPYVAIAAFGVALFAAVAWRTRARPRVVLAALAGASVVGAHLEWFGDERAFGDYWGNSPLWFTDAESLMMYGTALVFVEGVPESGCPRAARGMPLARSHTASKQERSTASHRDERLGHHGIIISVVVGAVCGRIIGGPEVGSAATSE